MRDKLIDLLLSVECEGEEGFPYCPERRYGGCRSINKLIMCQVGAIADHLLKNGVIVPPCKAGDSIYKVVKPKSSNVSDGWIVEQKVAGFHLGDIPRLRGDKRREYFIIFHEPTRHISHIPFDKLGKTVFLTKEEAEKALSKNINKLL